MDPVDVPAVLEIFSTSADGRWFVGLVVKQVGGGWLEIREGAGIWVSVVGVFEKKHHQKKTVDSKIGQHFFLVVLVVRGVFFFLCCNAWKKRSVSPVSKGVFHCGHLQDAQNLLTIRFLDEHGERTLEKTFFM